MPLWTRQSREASAGAVLSVEKPAGGSNAIWVAMIGACATVAVAFIQYLTQVTPLKGEIEQLKKAQTVVSPEQVKLQADVKRLNTELEVARKDLEVADRERASLKEKQQPEKPSTSDLSFGKEGFPVNLRIVSVYSGTNNNARTRCMSAAHKAFNELDGATLMTDTDSGGYYSFYRGKAQFHIVCDWYLSGVTTLTAVVPGNDLKAVSETRQTLQMLSKLVQ